MSYLVCTPLLDEVGILRGWYVRHTLMLAEVNTIGYNI